VFQEGERTGQNADPANISKQCEELSIAMAPVSLKRTTSSHLQIAGFFSRLTAKRTSSEDVERHEANKEKDIQEFTEGAVRTFSLQHPIMFEIVCQSKLSKFSGGMLSWKICSALELDVSSIMFHNQQS